MRTSWLARKLLHPFIGTVVPIQIRQNPLFGTKYFLAIFELFTLTRMSSPPAGTEPPAQPLPSTPSPVAATSTTKRTSGFRTALRYTGIPPSWFDKRPKHPSRNWLIFLSVSSSLLGLYAYDRKRCREIRNEYIQRVEHLAKLPLGSLELPRKVTVYASKWPGDEDYSRSVRYFKKYVKVRFAQDCVSRAHNLLLLL